MNLPPEAHDVFDNAPVNYDAFVRFWARQFAEHQLIAHLGLATVDLKNPPKIATLSTQPLVKQLKARTAELAKAWLSIFNSPGLPSYEELIDLGETTIRAQEELLDTVANDLWIGWLSFSLIQHINEETKYFLRKLLGEPFTYQTEIPFWLSHDRTETAYSGQLIDAREVELRKAGDNYITKVKKLEEEFGRYRAGTPVTLLPQVIQALEEFNLSNTKLASLIQEHNVLTNLSLDMVIHVVREARFSLQVFDWLAAQATYLPVTGLGRSRPSRQNYLL